METAKTNQFACVELKCIIKQHTATLHGFASNHQGTAVDPKVKEALLEVVSRLYQMIELLPETNALPPHVN